MNISVIVLIAIALVLVLYFALRRFESLSDRTTDELRDLLHGTGWLFYRNALLELRRRDEDIRKEAMPVLNLLISETRQQRIGGWLIAQELYPELAARIPDYRPQELPQSCREKIQQMLIEAG